MDNNTISGIIGIPEPEPELSFQERVITLYNSIVSEEHYDTDDIATMICEKMLGKNKTEEIKSEQHMFRLIHDIFEICLNHVRWLNIQHDVRVEVERKKSALGKSRLA